jgi:hypothetical protein
MDDSSRVKRSETQASGGTKEGVTRYVLMGGLVLVIVAFGLAYLLS